MDLIFLCNFVLFSPIVLASTVDGRVSALDVQHGVLLWKVNLEKPLVASSISKLIYQQVSCVRKPCHIIFFTEGFHYYFKIVMAFQ